MAVGSLWADTSGEVDNWRVFPSPRAEASSDRPFAVDRE
jgi:hypothetical protein